MENRRRNEDRRLKLDVIQSYGSLCSQKLKDSVSIIEEDGGRRLVFPVGKFIAQKDVDKSDMQFIKLSDNMESIQCMTMSSNKRWLAVSEKLKSESLPQVSIFNMRSAANKIDLEKRIFKYSESKSGYFSALAFSHQDCRFLVCLTGEPDYQILFLNTPKMKPIAHAALGGDVTKISISPKDNTMVAISGHNIFKILKVKENEFKIISEQIKRLAPNQIFTDHVWYDETKILLANDKGEIFIIKDTEVIQYITSGFNDIHGMGISCIASFSKGFIVGSDRGHMAIWVKIDDGDKDDLLIDDMGLSFLKRWHTDRKTGLSGINFNINEDLVAVAFTNNDIATIEMSQLLPNSSTELLESFKNNPKFLNREVKFDFLFNGFHNGPITCIDVCLQRPLIVTCSKYDATIRIWNYLNSRCELARKFYIGEEGNQQALGSKDSQQQLQSQQDISPLVSVAFHPSGYYLAAGFIDKLRIFHILHSELRVYRELPIKNATQVRFSNGGHMLAAAHPKPKANHYLINIYDAYTLELITTLKGHTHQVTEILWGPKDAFFASCGIDGGIYYWSTIDWSKQDNNSSNSRYHSMIYDLPTSMLLAAGTEAIKDNRHQSTISGQDKKDGVSNERNIVRELRMLTQQQQNQQSTTHVHDLGMQKINQICFIQSLHNTYGIIGGTDQGQIKIFSYIFNQVSFETMSIHQGEITKIRSSPDGRFVFTCGSDGAIFVYQVSEISQDGGIYSSKTDGEAMEALDDVEKLNPKAMVIDENLADVVLVARSEIETYIAEQKKLQNDLQDLDYKTEFKVQDERKINEKNIKQVEQKLNNEINSLKSRIDQIRESKDQQEKENNNLFKNLENNHLKAVEELENLYERKLAFENEKYLQIEQKLSEERMLYKQNIQRVEKKQDSNISLLKDEFQENFMKAEKVYESTKQSADELRKIYEEKLVQQEEEHEYEIKELNQKHKEEIEMYKKNQQAATREMEQTKRLNKSAIEEKERAVDSDQVKQQEIKNLQEKLQEANNRIDIQQKELEERDEQLKKKEKKIYEFKYKINDLQKSKHVLSFRTTEMRKSLEPKEAQIEKLKEEFFKLENEFADSIKKSKALEDKNKKLQNQVQITKQDYDNQCEITKSKESLLHKIIMDIHNTVNLKDEKEWKTDMKNLYQTYVLNQEVKQTQHDPKGLEEMSRQIIHLEKSIFQMNQSSEKIILRREKEIYKKTKENAELIYDLNDMRKQNKHYTSELSNKNIMLENLQTENQKLKQELQRYKSGVGFPGRTPQSGQHIDSQFDEQTGQQQLQQSNLMVQNKQLQQQPRQQSQPQRGKIIKGTNFDQKTLSTFDKAKIMDLMAEMELSTQKIVSQDAIIKGIRAKIMRHIQERNCNDPQLEEEFNLLMDTDENQRPFSQKLSRIQ